MQCYVIINYERGKNFETDMIIVQIVLARSHLVKSVQPRSIIFRMIPVYFDHEINWPCTASNFAMYLLVVVKWTMTRST